MACTNICLTEQKHELMGGCFACRRMALALCRPCWALFCGWQERCDGKNRFGWGSLLGGSLSHWYSSPGTVHAYILGLSGQLWGSTDIKPLKIFFRHRQVFLSPETDPWAQSRTIDFSLHSPSCGSIVQRAARTSHFCPDCLSCSPFTCDCIRTARTPLK